MDKVQLKKAIKELPTRNSMVSSFSGITLAFVAMPLKRMKNLNKPYSIFKQNV